MEIITKIELTDNSITIYTTDEYTNRQITPISIHSVKSNDHISIYDNTYRGILVYETKKEIDMKIKLLLDKMPVDDVNSLIGCRFKQHLRYYVVKSDSIMIKHTMAIHLKGALEILVNII